MPLTAETAGGRAATVAPEEVERALADFLLRRDTMPDLTASAFAAGVQTGVRTEFMREAEAMLEVDEVLGAARPRRLAGYRLLGLLGEGGTARVFEAEHEESGRRVALKVLHRHLSRNARSRARLCREARIAQTLSHPRIVPVTECGEADGQVFLVMRLLRGISLHRLLDAKQTPESADHGQAVAFLADHRRLARAFAEVADALEAAHARGVIHRDLKPSNLMTHADGSLTVLDFGLCSSPDARLTCSGELLGTPVYMSPEQAAGRHQDIGPHSDVYSLGAVLYECVTGQPTVALSSLPRVLAAVRGGFVPEAHRRAGVAAPLSRVLARCLQKNASHRYASARELAADLRAFADGAQPAAARVHLRKRFLHVAMAAGALALGASALASRSSADRVDAPAAMLPAEVTRNLAELARRDEAQFARELGRMLQHEGASASSH